jgi:hypothetical protein
MMNQSNTFDREISEVMHYRIWIDIKACLKQNEFWTEKKRGDEGYDPTQKYRLVLDVMTFNMNQIIEKGGLDVTMDETRGQTPVMLMSMVDSLERRQTREGSMSCCLTQKGDTCMHGHLVTSSFLLPPHSQQQVRQR